MPAAPSLIVIGGGATGTGIAREAAERGMRVTIIERGEFGSGTSGRFHGMLHSGARYAVADPAVAAECYQENQRLRKLIPSAITDTGGLFVAFTDQEAAHADVVLRACKAAGIPTREISVKQALAQEPGLHTGLQRAFEVPDGFIDGAELLRLNRLTASNSAGQITQLTKHKVTGFKRQDGKIGGVIVQNAQNGSTEVLKADYVINAAGVWAAEVAHLARVDIQLLFDKGTMIIFKNQLNNAVLNRCRPEDDGDLLVPHGGQSIMGTTARVVTNPNDNIPTQEEADVLIREGSVMVPALARAEAVKIYAGVRPLHGEGELKRGDSRAMSRSFSVLDHANQGLDNFVSVVGGKVTLYRLMAEQTINHILQKA